MIYEYTLQNILNHELDMSVEENACIDWFIYQKYSVSYYMPGLRIQEVITQKSTY